MIKNTTCFFILCLVAAIVPTRATAAELALGQTRITSNVRKLYGDFGSSVGVNGNTAIIGAPGENSLQGAAYLFVKVNGVWMQKIRLAITGGLPNDSFGQAVAVSGDTVLVSAHGENGSQGSVYVFVRSGSTWVQQARLTASDASSKAFFGRSLALEGNTAIVTAYGDAASRGAAYAFTRSNGVWTQQAKLVANDGLAGDSFGSAAALSGNTAVVGAKQADGTKGAAYVFLRSGSSWSQQARLSAANGQPIDNFGASVAISSNTAFVGSLCGNSCSGSVYVFNRSGSLWVQDTELTSPGATNFGSSLALVGDTALIGGPCGDECAGAAYVYQRQNGVWTQQSILTAATPQFDAQYGSAVALGGTTAMIGAWGEDTFLGAAYAQEMALPCSLSISLTYSAGTLSIDYTRSSSVSASWLGTLTVGSQTLTLWQAPVAAGDSAVSGVINIPLPPSGTVTVFSRLATTSGAVCSDSKSIDTLR